MKIKFSDQNTKMLKVMSLSLPPVVSCPNGVPCANGECYALKAYNMYPSARLAWQHNLDCYRSNPEEFFRAVVKHVKPREPKLFRWHVAGDIVDAQYFAGILGVANQCLYHGIATRFLVFTKQYSAVNAVIPGASIPSNLSIVLSAWPEYPMDNQHCLPIAWMQDGKEHRIPSDAIECHGGCEFCGICWDLKALGKDVYFVKH